VLSLLAAACGDLDVKSIRSPQNVAVWEGAWEGEWHSAAGGSGAVNFRVQEFRGEPLVTVEFAHACFEARPYELVMLPTTIELRAEGRTVLAAQLEPGPRATGTYDCGADQGLWAATRIGDLPEVLDLAGAWQGTLHYPGGQRAVSWWLEQEIVDGVMQVTAELDLGGLLAAPIPLVGRVDFQPHGFQIVLRTEAGLAPDIVLTAAGVAEPLQIGAGLLQVVGGGSLPFTQASLQLVREGH
jgi:hypothetical protein